MSESISVGNCMITYPDTTTWPPKDYTDAVEPFRWDLDCTVLQPYYYSTTGTTWVTIESKTHEMEESNESFKFWVKLPGYKKSNIKVNCDGENLEIKGDAKLPWDCDDSFNLQRRLTSRVLKHEVTAELADGLLCITLPKVHEERPIAVLIT